MARMSKKKCPVCHAPPKAPTLFVTAGRRSLHNGNHAMNPGERREVCGGCVWLLHVVKLHSEKGKE